MKNTRRLEYTAEDLCAPRCHLSLVFTHLATIEALYFAYVCILFGITVFPNEVPLSSPVNHV